MENWQWIVPRIFFGWGISFSSLIDYLALHKKRWAVCAGKHFHNCEWHEWQKRAQLAGLEVEFFLITGGEPTVRSVDELTFYLKKWKPEGIVGIGGGSVLDTAKAVSAMLVHEGSVGDYLEEVGTKKLSRPSLPWVGVPTTAGTGSEVTKNAVIIVPEKRVKRSLRDESLWASAVFLDPRLTLSADWQVTVNAALDAFTHLLEAAVSRKSHPWIQAFAQTFLVDIVENLPRVQKNPSDQEAREKLLIASTVGGMVLANGGLGAIHGFAATLGGMTSISHGRICGILLDHVVEVNSRYTNVYEKLLVVQRCGGIGNFIQFLSEWKDSLGIERDFKRFSLSFLPREIVELSTSSSMKSNPVDVPTEVWVAMWEKLL